MTTHVLWGLAALAVLAMAGARRPSGGVHIIGTPSDDLQRIRRRYDDGPVRAAALRWGALFFPGVPVSALMASGVTAVSRTERGGPPDYATGLYGVELRRAEQWANDAQTLRELGRPVDTSAPAFARDVEAQTYLGFRSYRAHCDAVARQLPERIRPLPGSVWEWRIAVAAYSSGDGTVARVVLGARETLSHTAANLWEALGGAILARRTAGHDDIGGVRIAGRWRAAYLVLRCERRFRAGRALADAVPELVSERRWYEGEALTDATATALQVATEAV